MKLMDSGWERETNLHPTQPRCFFFSFLFRQRPALEVFLITSFCPSLPRLPYLLLCSARFPFGRKCPLLTSSFSTYTSSLSADEIVQQHSKAENFGRRFSGFTSLATSHSADTTSPAGHATAKNSQEATGEVGTDTSRFVLSLESFCLSISSYLI